MLTAGELECSQYSVKNDFFLHETIPVPGLMWSMLILQSCYDLKLFAFVKTKLINSTDDLPSFFPRRIPHQRVSSNHQHHQARHILPQVFPLPLSFCWRAATVATIQSNSKVRTRQKGRNHVHRTYIRESLDQGLAGVLVLSHGLLLTVLSIFLQNAEDMGSSTEVRKRKNILWRLQNLLVLPKNSFSDENADAKT
jgi:hypothetical protein